MIGGHDEHCERHVPGGERAAEDRLKDVTQNKKISDKFTQKTLLVNQIQYNKKKDKKE